MLTCPYCGGKAVLVDAGTVYKHYNKKGKLWVCENYPKCDSYVGCHPNTEIPLGRLADPRLRFFKKKAHCVFDPIWRSGQMSRNDAYEWLAVKMSLPLSACHIGKFDVAQCKECIEVCKKFNNAQLREWKEKYLSQYKFSRGYKNRPKR